MGSPSLAERAHLATLTRQNAAAIRAAQLHLLLTDGECLKRAAWRVGVSYRTARRYKWMAA